MRPFVMLAFLIPAIGAAQDTAAVRHLEQQWVDAIGKRDSMPVAPMLDASYISALEDGSVIGRSKTLAFVVVADPSDPSAHVARITMPEIKVYGYSPDVAVATGIAIEEIASTRKGPSTDRFRFMDVWIRRHGHWICISSQYTGLR